MQLEHGIENCKVCVYQIPVTLSNVCQLVVTQTIKAVDIIKL